MSYSYGPRIVTDGLVLCFDAGNTKSYPGAGVNLNDLSGNGYNATLYNSPTFTNNYLSLDVIDDHIIAPYVLEPLSVDFWFYLNNRNDMPILYAGADNYNSSLWQWSMFNFGSQTYWAPGSSATTVTSFIPINSWVNAIIIRKSSSSLLYINGILASTFGSKTTVTGNIYIGKAGARYMNGRFSALRLYSKELSTNEIQQNYNATKARYNL